MTPAWRAGAGRVGPLEGSPLTLRRLSSGTIGQAPNI